MIKGNCSICETRKKKFVKLASVGGSRLLNDAIGKLSDLGVELHLVVDKGEFVPNGSFNNQQKYSYAGLGTKYSQRAREGYKGINELDRMAKLQD